MIETKHTPLPFKVVAAGAGVKASVSQLYKLETPLVGNTFGEMLDEQEANAAFFQKSANSFYRLDANTKKLKEPATCNAGHKTNLPLMFWDCPACTQVLRDQFQQVKDKAQELLLIIQQASWRIRKSGAAVTIQGSYFKFITEKAREVEAALKGKAE